MSAFVVEDKTINTVVSYLAEDQSFRQWLQYWYDINLNDETEREKMGKKLFAMNCEAINQRYGPNQAQGFRTLDYKWRYELPPPAIHTVKNLQCLLYQCNEGDVPETWPVYKMMKEIEHGLLSNIVCHLPAYEKARWGEH